MSLTLVALATAYLIGFSAGIYATIVVWSIGKAWGRWHQLAHHRREVKP